MEIQIILFAVIFFLLILIAILCGMIKTISEERNANEEEIWRITKENSRLIEKISNILKS